MPPRMRTQSVGRPVAESRGGGRGEQVGRGGRGKGPMGGNIERVDELNGQGNDQGMGANGGIEGVNENVKRVNGGVGGEPGFSKIIAQQLHNLLPAILAQVGNQGNVGNKNSNVVNENVQENIRNVLVNGNRIGCSFKELLACNLKEYEGDVVVLTRWIEKIESVQDMSGSSIDQKVKYSAGSFVGKALTWWNFQIRMLSWEVAIFDALTDEAVRNVSIKKVEKRENMREPSKDKNGHFARDCRVVPKNVNLLNVRNPSPARGACYECGSTDHLKLACPRLNRTQGPEGNRPNQVVANNGGQGRGKQGNQSRGRAFMLGAEEARQDPNIMTGLEPSELGFSYEIEIASGQLVEINKVIKGCKLKIEGHVFDIDLIPFGHGSFDVIIGERSKGKARLLMSAKASDKKQEEIVVSSYRLAHSELEELSGQPQELQDQ
nr:hypothetical protein [Tanacetum cinerariifolium]